MKVYPAAIAWHVPGRSHLLAEVVVLALRDIAPTGFPVSWQSYLTQIFHRFREALRRHPNIAPLIGAQLVANNVMDLEFVERLLAALAHAGFAGEALTHAYNSVIAALVGFTAQEFAPLPDTGTKAWQKEVRDRLRHIEPARLPVLAANLDNLINKGFTLRWKSGIDAPLDASFAFFVEVVIAGLEVLAAR